MIIKHKLHKIALVSIVLVLMLVSTASASRHGNGNVILKTDSCTGFVDFLKFPACGCDDDFGGCGDHSCNDKSCDKDKSCDNCPACNCPACVCPACNCSICPTCALPALEISKTGVLANQTNGYPINITYTYNITNIGNIPLSVITLYDNQTIPSGELVPGITTLNPGQSATTTSIYTGPFPATLSPAPIGGTWYGNITNVAYATAIGNGIQIVSNKASVTIPYQYPYIN
jgi:hypothetical protein